MNENQAFKFAPNSDFKPEFISNLNKLIKTISDDTPDDNYCLINKLLINHHKVSWFVYDDSFLITLYAAFMMEMMGDELISHPKENLLNILFYEKSSGEFERAIQILNCGSFALYYSISANSIDTKKKLFKHAYQGLSEIAKPRSPLSRKAMHLACGGTFDSEKTHKEYSIEFLTSRAPEKNAVCHALAETLLPDRDEDGCEDEDLDKNYKRIWIFRATMVWPIELMRVALINGYNPEDVILGAIPILEAISNRAGLEGQLKTSYVRQALVNGCFPFKAAIKALNPPIHPAELYPQAIPGAPEDEDIFSGYDYYQDSLKNIFYGPYESILTGFWERYKDFEIYSEILSDLGFEFSYRSIVKSAIKTKEYRFIRESFSYAKQSPGINEAVFLLAKSRKFHDIIAIIIDNINSYYLDDNTINELNHSEADRIFSMLERQEQKIDRAKYKKLPSYEEDMFTYIRDKKMLTLDMMEIFELVDADV